MKELILEILIDRMEPNGKGSGLFADLAGNEKRAEVPFTMIGDRLMTRVKSPRRGLYPGPLLELIEGAAQRIAARCPHFGTCGGCSWQHIPYREQLKIKEQFVMHCFQELLTDDVNVRAILASPTEWAYRNKMEFSFAQDRHGQRFLGLMQQDSRGKVFQLEVCYLPDDWFAETVRRVRDWWLESDLHAYHPRRDAGTLRTLTLRHGITTGDRMAILTVSGRPEYAIRQRDLDSFKALFPKEVSLYLKIHQAIRGQATQFYEMHLQGPEAISESLAVELKEVISTIRYHVSPSSFFQPNSKQAERIYAEALRLAEVCEDDVVYDLFCGTGTLGLLAARFVKQVIGIELSREAALDGQMNAKANTLENVTIVAGSVEDVLKNQAFAKPTLIMLDPPRAGLSPQGLEQVLALASPKIIYISCNPHTQARDIKALIQGGYHMQVIQPVDQFPQTPHIENIVFLKK